MERIKNYLINFMRGRYGIDQMSQTLFIAALYLHFCLQGLLKKILFEMIGIALFAYADYRALSKNIPARRAENGRYQEMVRNIKEKKSIRQVQIRHIVFTSAQISPMVKKIRVPKGKGKIEITSPKVRTEVCKENIKNWK